MAWVSHGVILKRVKKDDDDDAKVKAITQIQIKKKKEFKIK